MSHLSSPTPAGASSSCASTAAARRTSCACSWSPSPTLAPRRPSATRSPPQQRSPLPTLLPLPVASTPLAQLRRAPCTFTPLARARPMPHPPRPQTASHFVEASPQELNFLKLAAVVARNVTGANKVQARHRLQSRASAALVRCGGAHAAALPPCQLISASSAAHVASHLALSPECVAAFVAAAGMPLATPLSAAEARARLAETPSAVKPLPPQLPDVDAAWACPRRPVTLRLDSGGRWRSQMEVRPPWQRGRRGSRFRQSLLVSLVLLALRRIASDTAAETPAFFFSVLRRLVDGGHPDGPRRRRAGGHQRGERARHGSRCAGLCHVRRASRGGAVPGVAAGGPPAGGLRHLVACRTVRARQLGSRCGAAARRC
jgi:hypothetical protein